MMEKVDMSAEETESGKAKAYQDLLDQYEEKKRIALGVLDGMAVKYGIDGYKNIHELIDEIEISVDQIRDLFDDLAECNARPSRTEVNDARSDLRHDCELYRDAPLHLQMTGAQNDEGWQKLQQNIQKTIWTPFIEASLRVGHFW